MKKQYAQATTSEKIKLLKLLPQSWSYLKIEENFGANHYLIQEAKKEDSGISRIVGRPQINHLIKQKIDNFYKQDDISSARPGRKDCKSIKLAVGRETRQKRLLLHTLEETHRIYLRTCQLDSEKVSLTTFASLRPPECVFTSDSSAKEVCVCTLHANVALLMECLHKTDCFKEVCGAAKDILKLLKSKMMCDEITDNCMLRTCENCISKTNMIDYVAEKLDEHNLTQLAFMNWVMSPRTQNVRYVENVDDFLIRLDATMCKFLVHELKVKKQQRFVAEKKLSLIPGVEILAQLDFAEKFTCFVKDAPQSVYWQSSTVTICPVDVTAMNVETKLNEKLSYIFISDVQSQNTSTVFVFQKKLIPLLKAKYPQLEKVNYLSDGCAGQFKNRQNFKNICMHEKDFGVKCTWHFCPSSHGKGPCDGKGGCLKRLAMAASIRGEYTIDSALAFYNWTQSTEAAHHFKGDWNFVYVSKEECESAEKEFNEMDRFKDLRSIPGTQKFHEFIPYDEDHILCRDFSGQIKSEGEKELFALHKTKKLKREPTTEPIETIPKKILRLQSKHNYAEESDETD